MRRQEVPVVPPDPWSILVDAIAAHRPPHAGVGRTLWLVEGPPVTLPARVEVDFGGLGPWPEHAQETLSVLSGATGMAPEADVRIASPFKDGVYEPQSALEAILREVGPDDVVLIEVQIAIGDRLDLPLAADVSLSPLLAALHERCVVVAAAGNGGHGLTEPVHGNLVGAVDRSGRPLASSNKGPAVTLWMPGDHVLLPGTSRVVSGTSVAAAIAAGLALWPPAAGIGLGTWRHTVEHQLDPRIRFKP